MEDKDEDTTGHIGEKLEQKTGCLYQIVFIVTFTIAGLLWADIKLHYAQNKPIDSTLQRNVSTTHPQQCTPARNIFFLKMHKCGSSTVGNTLGRFAWLHNLTLATHKDQPFESRRPHPMISTLLPRYTPTRKYNIMNNHAVYNDEDIHKILHTEHKLHYVTIMREPVDRMKSYLNYIPRAQKHLQGKDLFKDLIRKLRSPLTRSKFDHIRNTMAFEFGIPANVSLTSDAFVRKFKDIRSKFVVLITEHFDESLVLLRRKYCWGSHNDILYLHIRHVIYHYSNSTFKQDKSTYCRWSHIDCFLYNYFNQTFWREVKLLGADFQNEVKQFKYTALMFDNYCKPILEQMRNNATTRLDDVFAPLQVARSAWSPGFTVPPSECALLYLRSVVMIDLFYLTQNPGVCQTLEVGRKCPWDPHMRPPACLQVCDHGDSREQLLYGISQSVRNTMLPDSVWMG